MGYLDNTSLTVDAILTKKGRQLLSEGALEITKFALSDDEIDYRLWDAAHSLGTNYYGEAIENMPVLEAFTDETQMMRYKLITLPKNTTKLPLVQAGASSITLDRPGVQFTINPSTVNISNGNMTDGYTCILSNSAIATLGVAAGGQVQQVSTFSAIGDNAAQSVSVVGKAFILTAKTVTLDSNSTITIIGNETGGSVTIPITVKKDPELDIITQSI
tara:strand:- start:681 stop:1331 length:651 start_codon:yes stop_codon:yes gene_type:complete